MLKKDFNEQRLIKALQKFYAKELNNIPITYDQVIAELEMVLDKYNKGVLFGYVNYSKLWDAIFRSKCGIIVPGDAKDAIEFIKTNHNL
jgi:hypothetical protein